MDLASKPAPQHGSYAQAPLRGTRFSMELDRAPCSEIIKKRGILCVSPYARATIFSGFRSCTLLRSQPQNGTYAQAPMRGPIRAPYARDTLIDRNKSWTLLRNHYKKRHPMRGPMRAPCARTRFYLDSDRASCFEAILAHRGLCANPMRGHIHQNK